MMDNDCKKFTELWWYALCYSLLVKQCIKDNGQPSLVSTQAVEETAFMTSLVTVICLTGGHQDIRGGLCKLQNFSNCISVAGTMIEDTLIKQTRLVTSISVLA